MARAGMTFEGRFPLCPLRPISRLVAAVNANLQFLSLPHGKVREMQWTTVKRNSPLECNAKR